ISMVKSPALTLPSATVNSPEVTESTPQRGARPPLCVALQLTSEASGLAVYTSPCFSATSCLSDTCVLEEFPPQEANRMAVPTTIDKKIFLINILFIFYKNYQ